MPKESNAKILLMQIREDKETQKEELDEFVRFSGIPKENFTVLDVYSTPDFNADMPKDFDAVFIGGSSDATVTKPEKYTFVEPGKKLIQYCVENSVPVFASCFGFQLAAEALGGKVIVDEENMEFDTMKIELTAEGKIDPLFSDFAPSLKAISAHKERAINLPSDAINLASTEKCPFHAFKIANKPFYAFQFHPEIDLADLVARLRRYEGRYMTKEQAEELINRFEETPEANKLIGKFVELFLT